ncbi:ABC transporter ATP-binding protein [Demequina lignilytica]|uniref:ABC transporter ATP-binding protein n=1 Tax=Demequina lignilytica TaxID=3051663 RepID=A0AB35MER1_9MICO|nr:ABC transporter ATP-binding protein [Demequina sp. SYSU T0a273]MDN4482256.1 ABC transporter ATP-binding protein [Demequina sp. SYSU T0a273]
MVTHHFGSLSWVILQILTMGCLIAAGVLSVTGALPITAGQVVLLSTYFTTLTGAAMQVLNLLPIMARGRVSARSVAEVLEDPDVEHNEGGATVERVTGAIRLERVVVRYGEDDAPALDGVTLDIPAGCTVAFVGASGSGKSTLVNTVLGFVRPSSGRVLLDGHDMAGLDLRVVRHSVAVVPQESVLFEGSVRDNVAYGLADVSDDAVVGALEKANVAEAVAALPEGLDTVVGSRGARLSGGQRQRISIARALIRDPRLLVLDEATSALDSESEHRVHGALATLMADRTTLVVAHRLSTVAAADLIVVLDHGRIVESGPHAELVARRGVRPPVGSSDPRSRRGALITGGERAMASRRTSSPALELLGNAAVP